MSNPVTKLHCELSKLPGIGEKTAMRLAYHILKMDEGHVRTLSETILASRTKIRFCDECFTFTQDPVCSTCLHPQRKQDLICVVEKPSDVLAIENSQRFDGVYHVLHGVLSPLDGIGPEQIRVRELITRVGKKNTVTEVVLAINPTVEGETTVVYLTKLLKPLGVRVSKIAHGIPVGGVLEYLDRQTIGRALENRVNQ